MGHAEKVQRVCPKHDTVPLLLLRCGPSQQIVTVAIKSASTVLPVVIAFINKTGRETN